MNLSLIVGFGWVAAATVTALLPMRLQFAPGVTLLICAPLVIFYLGWENGVWIGVAALAGFVSMFRRPLYFLLRKAIGRPVARPGAHSTQGPSE